MYQVNGMIAMARRSCRGNTDNDLSFAQVDCGCLRTPDRRNDYSGQSIRNVLILSFHSFPVIHFLIRHSASYWRDAVPTTALLGMMLSLRFLALLFQRHKLFHCDHHLPCFCGQGSSVSNHHKKPGSPDGRRGASY